MRTLIFIAGEYNTDMRAKFVEYLNSIISPNISSVDSQIISIKDHVQECNGDMKAAARTAKNKFKRTMMYSYENYIIVDNPNTSPAHWETYIEIARKLDENIFTMGFFIGKYKKWPNLHKFTSSMDKYQCVEDESAFPDLGDIIQNGEANV